MDMKEKQEVIRALQEELRGFFSWIIQELGMEYYIEDPESPSESLEAQAREAIDRRRTSKRMQVWERDWHAFSHHSDHPSVYKLFEAEDLEIVHYLEELTCEHFRILDEEQEEEQGGQTSFAGENRYEQSFGVLLASQSNGWMYRLDFCEVCGLVEIWSMVYHPEEIAWLSGER